MKKHCKQKRLINELNEKAHERELNRELMILEKNFGELKEGGINSFELSAHTQIS